MVMFLHMKIRGKYNTDLDAPTHSTLDVAVLVEAMHGQGISVIDVLQGSGLEPSAVTDQNTRISHRQKLSIFRNVRSLTKDPAIGLHAGQKIRISDFGIYGYALLSSANFGDALAFGVKNVKLAGPVLEKSFRIEGDAAIFQGHNPLDLDRILPLTSEFWFGSILSLVTQVLEREFPSRLMRFPYPPPSYAEEYEKVFRCPIEFGTGVLEWYFDAKIVEVPLPSANPITAQTCIQLCEGMMAELETENDLVQQVQNELLRKPGRFPRVEDVAKTLKITSRTLHRRLSGIGTNFQTILDGVRKRLAIEYLESTPLTIEEIADLMGFSEATNFRKAFKKWTNRTPREFREN